MDVCDFQIKLEDLKSNLRKTKLHDASYGVSLKHRPLLSDMRVHACILCVSLRSELYFADSVLIQV